MPQLLTQNTQRVLINVHSEVGRGQIGQINVHQALILQLDVFAVERNNTLINGRKLPLQSTYKNDMALNENDRFILPVTISDGYCTLSHPGKQPQGATTIP